MAVNNGRSSRRISILPRASQLRQKEFMCSCIAVIAARDSRLRDRKERETLNQKGASLFANWPLATQQRPGDKSDEARARKSARSRDMLLSAGRRNVNFGPRGNAACPQFRPRKRPRLRNYRESIKGIIIKGIINH